MERIHSLYLHVPFCTWLCKYCDFNAYAVLEGLIPPYVDALSREIEVAAAEVPVGPLETVFIGGRVRKWRGNLVGVDVPRVLRLVEDARNAVIRRAGFAINVVG